MMQLQDGYNSIPALSIDAIAGSRSDDGKDCVTATDTTPVSTCKSCFSGCWRMITGGVRNVRNYGSSVNSCRDDGESGAGTGSHYLRVSGGRLWGNSDGIGSAMSPGEGGAVNNEEKSSTSVKDQLELLVNLLPLFSKDDQERINCLNSEISGAETSPLKKDSASIADAGNNQTSHYDSELKKFKQKLGETLDRISESQEAEECRAGCVPAMLKKLSSSLEICSCEDLGRLCETIKIPDNLIRLFNSKLLKANLLISINRQIPDLFRNSPPKNDLTKICRLFDKRLLIKECAGNGLSILGNQDVLASYIKQQLRDKYRLNGIEKEKLENKLKMLTDPVDQILYMDILDIVYYECEAVKDITEEQAKRNKVMTLASFASVIAPSFQGRIETLKLDKLYADNNPFLKMQEMLANIDPEGLKKFMTYWPEIKKTWVGQLEL